MLSPVSRGLIVGALFSTWILYSYLFKQEVRVDDARSISNNLEGDVTKHKQEILEEIIQAKSSQVPQKIESFSKIGKAINCVSISLAFIGLSD